MNYLQIMLSMLTFSGSKRPVAAEAGSKSDWGTFPAECLSGRLGQMKEPPPGLVSIAFQQAGERARRHA
jgi:hypothetical protein